jgi:hypothetical protein
MFTVALRVKRGFAMLAGVSMPGRIESTIDKRAKMC